MKQITTSIFLFFLVFYASVWSKEHIAGTLKNVDLLVEEVLNKSGHDYGERYFGMNRNDFPVHVSIQLLEAKNVEDKLVPYTIIVKPLDKVKLGKVLQKNLKEEAFWNYEWQVQADQL